MQNKCLQHRISGRLSRQSESDYGRAGEVPRTAARSVVLAVFLGLLGTAPQATLADEVGLLLQTISRAGPQAVGSTQARHASAQLVTHGVQIVPRLLDAMDTANIVAANWYRTVYQQLVSRELARAEPNFPLAFLQDYARDPQRQGRTRRMILQLLDRLSPGFRTKILPDLLDDPEFRSDAVDFVIRRGDQAKARGEMETAKADFDLAFKHARDIAQVTKAADRLQAAGVDVNIVEHLGFVIRWYLLGPFDAPGRTGFDNRFPPEDVVDLSASYFGKDGAPIKWTLVQTADRLGQINLVNAIAPVKEAVGYAYAELIADKREQVELRCGADDNLTVWLNGKKIFARRQWLNGTRLDRFTAPAVLNQGKNQLLVKICQGPQHKNPAVPNNWSLQLRFCDSGGSAVALRSALPPPP